MTLKLLCGESIMNQLICPECGNHPKKYYQQMCRVCDSFRNICPKCKDEKNPHRFYCKVCDAEMK